MMAPCRRISKLYRVVLPFCLSFSKRTNLYECGLVLDMPCSVKQVVDGTCAKFHAANQQRAPIHVHPCPSKRPLPPLAAAVAAAGLRSFTASPCYCCCHCWVEACALAFLARASAEACRAGRCCLARTFPHTSCSRR